MSNTKANSGKEWTKKDESVFKDKAKHNTPTPLIAYELKRSVSAVFTKASELGVSLHPTNKSPYNRQKNNRLSEFTINDRHGASI